LIETESSSTANSNGNSFTLSGNWNVFKVTVTATAIKDNDGDIIEYSRSQKATAIGEPKSQGILTISEDGTEFTLDITGVGVLSGTVGRQRVSAIKCNAFKILDDDGLNILTRDDFKGIAKAFGSGLGWGIYDQRMDFNFNYRIDIADLCTAASNINQQ
jgi:hypothetical protein